MSNRLRTFVKSLITLDRPQLQADAHNASQQQFSFTSKSSAHAARRNDGTKERRNGTRRARKDWPTTYTRGTLSDLRRCLVICAKYNVWFASLAKSHAVRRTSEERKQGYNGRLQGCRIQSSNVDIWIFLADVGAAEQCRFPSVTKFFIKEIPIPMYRVSRDLRSKYLLILDSVATFTCMKEQEGRRNGSCNPKGRKRTPAEDCRRLLRRVGACSKNQTAVNAGSGTWPWIIVAVGKRCDTASPPLSPRHRSRLHSSTSPQSANNPAD
nr:uncharacterized protein LOC124222177 [Neodiprion pinetum]